ncbi:MAG TPA: hypothetical protein VFX49_18660 [Chloroflexota bacterium]|nr:hypothetical protein [Chloroflexota bacterium]
MEMLGSLLVGVILVTIVLFVVPRLMGGNTILCTRCEGTGQVDERWPDPSKPTGFHTATGTCPKCRGKGRVKPQ